MYSISRYLTFLFSKAIYDFQRSILQSSVSVSLMRSRRRTVGSVPTHSRLDFCLQLGVFCVPLCLTKVGALGIALGSVQWFHSSINGVLSASWNRPPRARRKSQRKGLGISSHFFPSVWFNFLFKSTSLYFFLIWSCCILCRSLLQMSALELLQGHL